MAQLPQSLRVELRSDEVDPELLALPAPPRAQRLVALGAMTFTVLAALLTLFALRHDIAYFVAAPQAEALGEAAQLQPAELVSNRYVRIAGTPMLSAMVRYEQRLTQRPYLVFPLAGQRHVFVQLPAEALEPGHRGLRTSYSGRLVTFGGLGSRMSEVRSYLHQALGLPVTGETFVLKADERPGVFTEALGLALFCVGLVLLNVWMLLRWFRPLPVLPASER